MKERKKERKKEKKKESDRNMHLYIMIYRYQKLRDIKNKTVS